MNKLKRYITFITTQMAFAFCVVGYGYTQYANQLNVTSNKIEATFNYNWDKDSLVSVTVIQDSLWYNYGYAGYEFKKYDQNFNTTIEKRHVDTNNWYVFGRSMAYNSGGYYVTAQKRFAAGLNDTAFASMIKFDSLGNKVWDKVYYPQSGGDVYNKFAVSHDSLIVFTGAYYDTTQTGVNKMATHVTAIDTSGAIIWEKFFTGYNLQPVNFKKTSDGGFILTAYTQVTAANDTRVYKLDNLGNTQWVQTLGNALDSHWLGAQETPSGDFICYGWKTVPNVKKSWLVKLDNSGNIVKDTLYDFSKTLGYLDYFNPEGNVVFTPSGIYIVGWYKTAPSVLSHTYLTFVNYDLEVQWFRSFSKRTYLDIVTYISPYKPNPNYLFMGGISFSDDTTNTNDEWFIVVDSLGCDVFGCSVGIEEPQKQNTIFSIYPNPTNGKVTFQLQQRDVDFTSNNYEIVITDMQGKLVKILPVNNVSISYEFLKQQHGIYLIHLVKNKQRVQTQKLILVE